MLFDWLVTGRAMPTNPAHAVRGPKHSVKKGKTSVLDADEMRDLIASIDIGSLIGLRDRALIALMGYTFARVGAAVGMKVEDFYVQNRRGWVRLHRCRVCDAPGTGKRSIIVHHRVPGRSELKLMISLCPGCHARIHRTRAVLVTMPPLLLELWREQHPSGHEQITLNFKRPVPVPAKIPRFY